MIIRLREERRPAWRWPTLRRSHFLEELIYRWLRARGWSERDSLPKRIKPGVYSLPLNLPSPLATSGPLGRVIARLVLWRERAIVGWTPHHSTEQSLLLKWDRQWDSTRLEEQKAFWIDGILFIPPFGLSAIHLLFARYVETFFITEAQHSAFFKDEIWDGWRTFEDEMVGVLYGEER